MRTRELAAQMKRHKLQRMMCQGTRLFPLVRSFTLIP